MTRPTIPTINTQIASWDSLVSLLATQLRATPWPVTAYDPATGIPAASSYDNGCIAVVNHAHWGWVPVVSDGADWFVVGPLTTVSFDGTGSGAVTSVDLSWGAGRAMSSMRMPLILKTHYVAAAVINEHQHGSDSGDWTLTADNVDATAPVTLACAQNAVNDTEEVSFGLLSGTGLTVDAGERLSLTYTGPSTTDPLVAGQLLGFTYAEHLLS